MLARLVGRDRREPSQIGSWRGQGLRPWARASHASGRNLLSALSRAGALDTQLADETLCGRDVDVGGERRLLKACSLDKVTRILWIRLVPQWTQLSGNISTKLFSHLPEQLRYQYA